MNATASQIEYELTEHRLLPLTGAEGHRIVCISGRALITAYAEAADFELSAGQVFVVPNPGLVLVEAIKHGRIRVIPPARRGYGWGSMLLRGWRSVAGQAPA
jgi:hypothetical protein